MDGENPDVRTCSDCFAKKEEDNLLGKKLCCESCLERKRHNRVKTPEKGKEKNKRYKAYRKEYI